jgi:hypothetical protein
VALCHCPHRYRMELASVFTGHCRTEWHREDTLDVSFTCIKWSYAFSSVVPGNKKKRSCHILFSEAGDSLRIKQRLQRAVRYAVRELEGYCITTHETGRSLNHDVCIRGIVSKDVEYWIHGSAILYLFSYVPSQHLFGQKSISAFCPTGLILSGPEVYRTAQ